MLLSEILHASVVKLELDAETKHEAIAELVDRLIQAHDLPMSQRDAMIEAVDERESHGSTGMEHGVAVPHCGTDRVNEIIGAIGISKSGVPFESTDREPAHIIILLLLPKRQFAERVHTMAGVAHLLENADLRTSIQSAADADVLLSTIESAEANEKFAHIRVSP
jgi:mannitol/fructose-specific phosphotransferase system IIA component (Ntr-type)